MDIDFYTKSETDVLIEDLPSGGGEIANGFLREWDAFDVKKMTANVQFTGRGLSSYEFIAAFRITNPVARSNVFFGSASNFYYAPSCEINENGIWHGFPSNGSSWVYFAQTALAQTPITYGDFLQFIKITWDGETQSLYHSLDGRTWTLISSFATPSTAYAPTNPSYVQLGCANNSAYHIMQVGNEICFIRCAIKFNGELVWGRLP